MNFKIIEDQTTRVVRFEELTQTTPLEHRPYDWPESHNTRHFHPEPSGFRTSGLRSARVEHDVDD